MAKPKDEIPVGSRQAFYAWVKQKFPGWWPRDEDMGKIDWSTGRNLEMYNQWVEEGKGVVPLAHGKEQFPSPGLPPPSPGLPGEVGLPPEAVGGYQVMVGDQWFYYGKNNVYYDLVGGQWLPVDPEAIRKISQPEPADPRLALDREKWESDKYARQVEQERQQAEGRNKAWALQSEIQRQQSETDIQKQQNEMELIKGRAFPFGDEAGRRRAFQEATAGAFESARQSILASLSSPSDWIKKWEVQNAPNPYTPQPQSRLEQSESEVENTRTRANMFDQMANEAEKLVAQLEKKPTYTINGEIVEGASDYEGSSVLAQAQSDVTNYRNAANAERNKLGKFQTDVSYLQGQPQPAPSAPAGGGNAPAPSWLPMFAPGQQAGQAITRQDIPTPSAQQWAATPWSVQQGLAGYTDWSGYRPMADILGNMAQMLPNSPGGGARWSPYIGR